MPQRSAIPTPPVSARCRTACAAGLAALLLAGCAANGPPAPWKTSAMPPAQAYALANRLSWGANPGAVAQAEVQGPDTYLARQLHPRAAALPPAVQQQIDAMTISQRPMDVLVAEMDQRRRDSDASNPAATEDERKAA
ncbi:MAG: hypothetical protein JWP29_3444, partial [Rhodoferax sp.]|nr:hypothetical protein [Rhodoferax sp.]